jgi:TM2 domain-containing membrane protein YozV
MPPVLPPPTSEAIVPPAPRYSVIAGVLSYLIPGLGQICQGRVSKGVFFMAVLLGLFFAGQALGDWRNVYLPNAQGPDAIFDTNPWRIPGVARPFGNVLRHRWQYAGQFWIGVAAWPAIWQYYNLPVPAEATNKFWHDFQRGPSYLRDRGDYFNDEENLRQYIRARDKTPDVAWVYTVIAGVLNILVIYDAFAGPAYLRAATAEKKGLPTPLGEVAPP